MADKLDELYGNWKSKLNWTPDPNSGFQCFQGGVTTGAVSMRERAMAAVQALALPDDEKNILLNAIGKLSDIPA